LNKSRLKYYLQKVRKQNLLLSLSIALIVGFSAFVFFKSIYLTLLFLLFPFLLSKTYKISKGATLKVMDAKKLERSDFKGIYEMVDLLSLKADLGYTPNLYLIPSDIPNSMAIGDSNESGIGISHGLINHLNSMELYGVLSHEISHIKNQDYKKLKVIHIAYSMVSFISLLINILVLLSLPLIFVGQVNIGISILFLALIAPRFIQLLILGLMRNFEYKADLTGCELIGDPLYLASALLKINDFQQSKLKFFLFHRNNSETRWLDTHPSSMSRIKRLCKLSR